MRLTLAEIARCLGLEMPVADEPVFMACIDSRDCQPGDIFFCIPGENADGHDFAALAVEAGARAVVAEKTLPGLRVPVFVVDKSERALGKIARYWRDKCAAKVICITGTAGKTTLKETLASILSLAGKTARTDKNHNNQIGLPLSMLAADGDDDFWIMEAGISHAGDMDELGLIAGPDMAIILNVGCGHTEGLGDKGVAWHKTRLLKYLRPGGMALVSADYPDLLCECGKMGVNMAMFSVQKRLHTPFSLEDADYAKGEYSLALDGAHLNAVTPFKGEYGAEVALAAASAATLLGVAPELIARGLAQAKLPAQRFNNIQAGGWHIIDDTYNANPLSMQRMLRAASAGAKHFIAVLGAMGELGSEAKNMHVGLGKLLAELNPAAVFWKGPHSEDVLAGLNAGGFDTAHFYIVSEPLDFMRIWGQVEKENSQMRNRGTIIFKGSRANRLERFVKAFVERATDGQANVL